MATKKISSPVAEQFRAEKIRIMQKLVSEGLASGICRKTMGDILQEARRRTVEES